MNMAQFVAVLLGSVFPPAYFAEQLAAKLDSDDYDTVVRAALGLAYLASPVAVPALQEKLATTRGELLAAEAAQPDALTELWVTYAVLRGNLVYALGEIGDARAVPALIAELDSTHPANVAAEAADALEKIDTPTAIIAARRWRATGTE